MKKQRNHYTPEEKAGILRRHLLENEPISKLCDELGLQPTVFYRWQKEFFENGAAAFEQKSRPNHSAEGGSRRSMRSATGSPIKGNVKRHFSPSACGGLCFRAFSPQPQATLTL